MYSTFPNPIEVLAPFQDYYRKPKQALGGLEKRVERIILVVKQAILAEMPLKPYFSQYLITILQFRMELLQEFPTLVAEIDEVYVELENSIIDEEKNSRFYLLSQNIGFAMRVNKRVINHLIKPHIAEKLDITSPLFEEWVLASVLIEFGIMAEVILKNESIYITDKRINDFAALVAESAQDFGALSRMLGVLPQKKHKFPSQIPLVENIMAEQYALAEQGMEEYWNEIQHL